MSICPSLHAESFRYCSELIIHRTLFNMACNLTTTFMVLLCCRIRFKSVLVKFFHYTGPLTRVAMTLCSFVVSFFLADDTLLIFERAQPNSGWVGGKFLERRQIRHPAASSFYGPQDMRVGAKVHAAGRSVQFRIHVQILPTHILSGEMALVTKAHYDRTRLCGLQDIQSDSGR